MAIEGSRKGLFIPTNNVWDVDQIDSVNVNSPEFKELLVRLYQNINNISMAVNLKDSGYYVQNEFISGQVYFQNPALNSTTATRPQFRDVIRKVINFGSLPNTGTKSVPHELTPNSSYSFTRIYGTASDTTGLNYIPLPYASPVLANNIELKVDATNVTIITGSNRSNFNITYVVLEFITS